jgi:hypothetical protein
MSRAEVNSGEDLLVGNVSVGSTEAEWAWVVDTADGAEPSGMGRTRGGVGMGWESRRGGGMGGVGGGAHWRWSGVGGRCGAKSSR